MSIIWCGGEPIDFRDNTLGEIEYYAYAGSYGRSDFVRGTISIVNSITKQYISNNFPTPVSSGDIWIHGRFYMTSLPNTDNTRLFGLQNSVSGDWIGVGCYSQANNLLGVGIKESSGSVSWLNYETNQTIADGYIAQYDLHIINYGSNGTMVLFLDGKQILSYTGDIRVGSTTEFNQIVLQNLYTVWTTYFSELIVADEDTRLMSLKTLAPNAAGDTNQWNGSYIDIYEEGLSNDNNTIYTNTAENDIQVNVDDLPTIGDFRIKGVKLIARATDGVGNLDVQMGIKTNGALHLGSTIPLDNAWKQYEQYLQQNPETISEFTPAEIEALQIAFRSKTAV